MLIRNAYLTPACHYGNTITGAVYGRGRLVVCSQRRTAYPVFVCVDPPTVAQAPEMHIEEAHYLGHYFAHFGHFLIETLTACHREARAGSLPILFHPWTPIGDLRAHPFFSLASFFFEAIGVDADRVQLVNRPTAADVLHMEPRCSIPDGVVPSWTEDLYRTLRGAIIQRYGRGPYDKVYFSRRLLQQGLRDVPQEERIEAEFAAQGFTILHPETLPIVEQARIACGATVIAGCDGSALHWSALMGKGGEVVVVNTRAGGNLALLAISGALGLGVREMDAEEFEANYAAVGRLLG
jgi:capsular polysaccharide biosynthesis protein